MYFDTIMSTAVESTESTIQIIPNGTIGAIVQCGNVTINVHNHTIVDGRSDAYDAAHHGGSTVPSTAASTPPTAPSTFGGNGWQLQQQQESGLTLLDNFKTAPSENCNSRYQIEPRR